MMTLFVLDTMYLTLVCYQATHLEFGGNMGLRKAIIAQVWEGFSKSRVEHYFSNNMWRVGFSFLEFKLSVQGGLLL